MRRKPEGVAMADFIGTQGDDLWTGTTVDETASGLRGADTLAAGNTRRDTESRPPVRRGACTDGSNWVQ